MIGARKEKVRSTQRSLDQQVYELHELWYQMNLIERVNWKDEAKRTPQKRLTNWICHVVAATLFIATVTLMLIPHRDTHHYVFAVISGYITVLNFYALKWFVNDIRLRYRHRDIPRK